ncbi:MAG: hypothetical protein MUC96_15415 [Myxococcaceae bacterium]|nr:hypothetical protein [Myxococcaceae bacterium]
MRYRIVTRYLVGLYCPDDFDPSLVSDLLENAEPVDDYECLRSVALRPDLHAFLYDPPVFKTFSERWNYGREYFDQTLSGQLADVLRSGKNERQQVVLVAYDDSTDQEWLWRLHSEGEERRWISDGQGCRDLVDKDGNQDEVSGPVSRNRARFAASPVLKELFGLTLEQLTTEVGRAPMGQRLWPRPPATARKPAAQKLVRRKKPLARKAAARSKKRKAPTAGR